MPRAHRRPPRTHGLDARLVDFLNRRADLVEYVVKQLLGLGLTVEQIRGASEDFAACTAEPADAGAPPVEQG